MNIKKSEVLRYLGYRGQALGEGLDRAVDEAVETCRRLARPRYTYRVFETRREEGGVRLAGTGILLPGRDIAAFLEGAARCALLAATLGVEVESRIRVLERADLTAALLLDAAATAAVEAVCDEAQAALADEAERLFPGGRYSPGYGDLPLSLQPEILAALDAGRRIGLTCTDRLLLLPRKSVTAAVGLFPEPAAEPGGSCDRCPLRENCIYHADQQ